MKNKENLIFTHPVRVYWEDTDGGGIVYYANYLKFAERARTEWLRSLGHDQSALRDKDGIVFVVRECRVQYKSPARLDDALQVTVAVKETRRHHLVLEQNIWRGDGLCARLVVTLVTLAAADGTLLPLPGFLTPSHLITHT